MKLWLIYRQDDKKKNEWYIEQYQEIGKELGIDVELVLTNQLMMSCNQEGLHLLLNGKDAQLPDGAIVRTIDPKLSMYLESMGIPIFNSARVSTICNDKAKTYFEIAKLHLPMIPTIACKRYDLQAALEQMTLPAVVKTVDGHGGQEVFLVESSDNVGDILERTSSDFVVQPLYGNKHQDLRVYILGNKVLAAILRTSNSGFKANFSLGGSVCQYELNENEISMIQKILDHFQLDLAGIDFLIGDQGELIFNEIEDVVGARMLYQCTQINLVLEYLRYIKHQLSVANGGRNVTSNVNGATRQE